MNQGVLRSPKGIKTYDLGYTVIELETPYNALPLNCGRGLNVNIAAAEAVQLIGGFSEPDLLTKAAPSFDRYLNNGSFHGAYGSRIGWQVPNVVTKLARDPNTRQAVITLWDPVQDNLEGMNDYPCTVVLQFETDSLGRLCMNAVMRSNDVWLGLPYDMFQFTQLQLSVARALRMEVGWYRHTAFSMHLYEQHFGLVANLRRPRSFVFQPSGIGRDNTDSISEIMKRARQTTAVAFPIDTANATESEQWYRGRFASYLGPDVDGRRADDGAPIPL